MTHICSVSSPVACWPWFVSCISTPFSINFVNILIQDLFTSCLLIGFFLFPLWSKQNTLAGFIFLKEIHLILPLLFKTSQFISIFLVSRALRSSFILQACLFLQRNLFIRLRTILWLPGQALLTLTSLSFLFIFIPPYINDDFKFLRSAFTALKPRKHHFLCILIAHITYRMLSASLYFLSRTHLFTTYAEYCARHWVYGGRRHSLPPYICFPNFPIFRHC